MKQQVCVIHGGTTFDTHEEYLDYLKNCELSAERLKAKSDWKNGLGDALGDRFEVFVPRMPNSTNARFEEWRIWFERCLEFFDDNVILVGHSLGGIFLAKYLSQPEAFVRARALILVAAPFGATEGESLVDFAPVYSLDRIVEFSQSVHLFHSDDDPVVPMVHAGYYQKALPAAVFHGLQGRGHITQPEFPELISLIESFIE